MPRVHPVRARAGGRRHGLLAVLASFALLPPMLLIPEVPTSAAGAGVGSGSGATGRPAVIGHRLVGKSVQGRKIIAWHLGEPGKKKVILIALMHGNEPAPHRILENLRDGPRVHGINLWVVPTYNPDGFVHHTRKNAHDVDLNRNYPYKWVNLDGAYESGPKPASEPETRAMMRFLSRQRPSYILSFHQPLHAVDVTERPKFSKRVARALGLPMSRLTCGGTCHGTMTMWFNHKYKGFALTVEYGAHPSRARVRAAPGKILGIFGAWRGKRR